MIALDPILIDLYENETESALKKIELLFECLSLMRRLTSISQNVGASYSTLKALSDIGKYPERDYIKDFLVSNGLEEVFNVNDVYRAISSILLDFPDIEQYMTVKEVVNYKISDFDIKDPDLRSEEMIQNTRYLFSKLVLEGQHTKNIIVLSDIDVLHQLNVSFELVEYRDGIINEGVEHFGNLNLLMANTDYMLRINYIDLWNEAKEKDLIANIIKERAIQLMSEIKINKIIKNIEVGEHFFDSLVRNAATGGGKFSNRTLDVCAKVAIDPSMVDAKPFYEDETRKSQRASAGRLAWRVHINKSSEALRLMFWSDESLIRISNIGPKTELEIYD